MAYAMTKQGSLDNCITYEFICDTIADMNAIENRYRTIGSVAVVLEGEGGGMEAYITGSNKQWNNLGSLGASNSGSSSSIGGLSIHICTQNEVSNGLPNIQDPDETTIYLVSAGNESGNLYEEYIYANENWEKFGTGNVETNLPFIYDHQEETTLNFENLNQYEDNEVTIDDITVLREGPATLRVGSNTYALDFYYYDYDDQNKGYGSPINGDSDNGAVNITIPSDTDATTNVQGLLYFSVYDDFDGPQNVSITFPPVSDLISTANNLYVIEEGEQKEKVATERYVSNNYLSIATADYDYVKQDAMGGKINKYYNFDFEPIYFKGMTSIQGNNIWTDGTNIYYSNLVVLNRESSTWEDLKMDPPTRYDYSFATNIWTDGDNIYYSDGSSQYILNKSKMTWDIKKWQGYVYITGQDVWTDGNNIYYSAGSQQYVLNKSTSTWETKSWGFALGTDMKWHLYGRYILNDGEHIYNYSNPGLYILNENTWSTYSISNTPASFNRQYVWTDGDNIYYSKNSNSYILNKSNSSWETITWDNLTSIQGDNVWTDGINIYYSYGTDNQYVFNKSNSTWSQKEWYGLHPYFQGDGFWADGNNIYYSSSSLHQYILDKSTLTLTKKTWNILNNNLFAQFIWSDNENIYYSNGIQQYVFDKSNLTWNEKVWIGLNNFDGQYVWTDGEDFYYSVGTQSYILDKATSTWSEKNWEEIDELYGNQIWTDGKYIYYSFGEDQYQFYKTDSYSTWYNTFHDAPFTIQGSNIWTDGEDIYYNNYTKQYKLDQNTDNWYEIDYAPLTSFDISGLWKDGNDLYYTKGQITYKLVRTNKVLLGVNGQYTPVSVQTFMKENSIIPAPPSTDGTYTLQATVASGVITYTWVAGA